MLQDTVSEESSVHAKPTDLDLDCPQEFQAIMHTFSAKMLHDAYPLLHLYDAPLQREYLGVLVFLRRYEGYKFAWIIEKDVRYTGADWGHFLTGMLNLAIAPLHGQTFAHHNETLIMLPGPDTKVPDFVTMGHATVPFEEPMTESYQPRDTEKWKFNNYVKTMTNIWGASRLYIELLRDHSMDGNGGFIEDFVLTVAVEENLDVVTMPYPDFDGGASINCCGTVADQYYTNWYLSGQCRYPAILHPVKNTDSSIWGDG